jgi:hypothetical protein
MRLGSFLTEPTPWPFTLSQIPESVTLYHTALHWLKEDREHRRQLEEQGRKTRGARRNQVSNLFVDSLSYSLYFSLFRRTPKHSTRSRSCLYSTSSPHTDDCFQIRLRPLDLDSPAFL